MDELKNLGDVDVLRATWAMLTSAEGFAAEHHANLDRGRRRMELLMKLPSLGKRPHHSTKAGERLYADEALQALRSGLRNTFLATGGSLAVALAVGALAGVVHPALPWHAAKLLQVAGGALALWGTLFALHGPAKTWSGGSVGERVHGFVFTCLLGVGGGLAILGTLL